MAKASGVPSRTRRREPDQSSMFILPPARGRRSILSRYHDATCSTMAHLSRWPIHLSAQKVISAKYVPQQRRFSSEASPFALYYALGKLRKGGAQVSE